MIEIIKKLFGIGPSVNFKEEVKKGAIIIDVRTPEEFRTGHIKSAINIPLNVLSSKISKIPKDKTIITCCASGMRSSSAKSMLKSKGYTNVHNGGSWYSLRNKIA